MFIETLSANYFDASLPTPVVILLFTIMALGFLLPMFFVVQMLVGWYRNKNLLINGEAAQAKILKIWETGVTVNDQPQIGFLLEVHAANRPVFQGEAKRVVSILNVPRVQVGSTVEVKFDPQNPSRIAVVL